MPPSATGSALVAHHRAPRLPLRLLLVPILILACGEGEPDVVAPAPVPTTLAITPPSAVLASLGQTVQLTATVRDQTGALMTGVAVNWASSDGGVATVDASGLVTAVEDGAANITATVRGGGASGSAAITVEQQIVEVRLTPDPRVFSAIGQTLQMSAEALDANGHPVQGRARHVVVQRRSGRDGERRGTGHRDGQRGRNGNGNRRFGGGGSRLFRATGDRRDTADSGSGTLPGPWRSAPDGRRRARRTRQPGRRGPA